MATVHLHFFVEWMSSEVLCYTKKEVKANRVAEIYSYSVINGTKTLLYDEKDERLVKEIKH